MCTHWSRRSRLAAAAGCIVKSDHGGTGGWFPRASGKKGHFFYFYISCVGVRCVCFPHLVVVRIGRGGRRAGAGSSSPGPGSHGGLPLSLRRSNTCVNSTDGTREGKKDAARLTITLINVVSFLRLRGGSCVQRTRPTLYLVHCTI